MKAVLPIRADDLRPGDTILNYHSGDPLDKAITIRRWVSGDDHVYINSTELFGQPTDFEAEFRTGDLLWIERTFETVPYLDDWNVGFAALDTYTDWGWHIWHGGLGCGWTIVIASKDDPQARGLTLNHHSEGTLSSALALAVDAVWRAKHGPPPT